MSDTLEQTPSAEAEGKHRRLVPQFSLNNRAEQKQAHHGDAAKKPGFTLYLILIRFK